MCSPTVGQPDDIKLLTASCTAREGAGHHAAEPEEGEEKDCMRMSFSS